jgi:hypothetical protein
VNGKAALELVREIGIGRLGGFDGCLCTSCEVQGVNIDVSCRKSNGSTTKIAPGFYGILIRVHSQHMDAGGDELEAVAREVAQQLAGEGCAIMARFTDYRHDAEGRCTYCGKPRSDLAGYLCDKCLTRDRGAVAASHDYRRHDFACEPVERKAG